VQENHGLAPVERIQDRPEARRSQIFAGDVGLQHHGARDVANAIADDDLTLSSTMSASTRTLKLVAFLRVLWHFLTKSSG
jgi:hypothetical protein